MCQPDDPSMHDHVHTWRSTVERGVDACSCGEEIDHADVCDGSDGHGEYIGPPQ